MSRLLYSVSISLDGFVAGANQSEANPLGVGGELLHAWMRELSAWRRDALGTDEGVTNASTDDRLKFARAKQLSPSSPRVRTGHLNWPVTRRAVAMSPFQVERPWPNSSWSAA
jgi:hypothetical protein